jgi:hypothetical protein
VTTLELFGVVSQLLVGSVPPVVVQSKGDGLRFEWEVRKTRGSVPDQATISIYNLWSVHHGTLKISAALGNKGTPRATVQLGLGWREHLGAQTVFSGRLLRVKRRQQNVDVITELECGDGNELDEVPPQGGSEVAIPVQLAVASALQKFGLKASPAAFGMIAAAAARTPLQAFNMEYEGGPREILDGLMATIGLSWGIAAGLFVVYVGGLRNDVKPGALAPKSGLISATGLDDGSFEFEALAQPRFVPGMQITLHDELFVPLSGPLRVESIEFSGSSEGPSLMRGVARAVELSPEQLSLPIVIHPVPDSLFDGGNVA